MDERAGGDAEVELAPTGTGYGSVELSRPRRLAMPEESSLPGGEQLLLIGELGLNAGTAQPLVEDQRRDRDSLPLLDDATEGARGTPGAGQRIHEH